MEQSVPRGEWAAPPLGQWWGAEGVGEADGPLVAALRRGDAGAFDELHRQLTPLLLAVARRYSGSPSLAEDIVQDTWLGVVQGIARFEGRSTLKTWIMRILHYRARSASSREGRSVAMSSFPEEWDGVLALALDGRGAAPGSPSPEEQILGAEMSAELSRALAALPATQRAVVLLRDVVGWTAAEVCAHLGLSATNQRVLLHRGRKQMRHALGGAGRGL